MQKNKPKTCKWEFRTFGLIGMYKPNCRPIGFYSGIFDGWNFCPYCGRKIEVVK